MYKEIKLNFGTDNCLLMNLPKSYKSILAQFIYGILPIIIDINENQYMIGNVSHALRIL